jgi:hypothetical protein
MESDKNQQQQNTGNRQRDLDKNKTLDNPGANVVDYGRSEQNADNNREEARQQGSESKEKEQ